MDVSAGSALGSYAFNVANNHSNMGWQSNSLTFTANAPTTTISFDSTTSGNCCWGPALDNVAIAAVPEPATWTMAIMGFGLVGASLRRRPSRAAAAATA